MIDGAKRDADDMTYLVREGQKKVIEKDGGGRK